RAWEGGVGRLWRWGPAQEGRARTPPAPPRRLSEPVPWDRQAEHAPDDAKVSWQPVFERAGSGLRGRYNESLVANAEELEDKPLDDVGHDAIRAMSAVLNAPRCWVEFTIEQGQLQYLNNRLFAHSRTPFPAGGERERSRPLIRLWNREEGRKTFHA